MIFSVIIEEAAEVLESHVVTSLTTECKHVILIGNLFMFFYFGLAWVYIHLIS